MTLAAIGNHLWQSTAFAAIAALAALALRRHRASVRHTLWLAASIKFLVPFTLLVAIAGSIVVRPIAPPVAGQMTAAIDAVSQPFTVWPVGTFAPAAAAAPSIPASVARAVVAIWIGGTLSVLAVWCRRWRHMNATVRAGDPITTGEPVATLRRLERVAGVRRPIAIVASPSRLEPGVFGIVRPVLMWPVAIDAHLSAEQRTAVLAHEVAHVRRRDNLTAAIHTVVQAVFWFHPLVWWIGARLVDERERACDDHVIQAGGDPEMYAATIVTACRLYLEAPQACVAGVTGSDLKRRVERIMTHTGARNLSARSKALLAAVSVAALVVPIAAGVMNSPRLRAQSAAAQPLPQFEVASVKPSNAVPGRVGINTSPGGRFTATNAPLALLIQFAYGVQPHQIIGGPDWMASDRFDIVAKGDEADAGNEFVAAQADRPSQMRLMLRALLADRFKLESRTESRDLPIYSLVVSRADGRLGESLQHASGGCSPPAGSTDVVTKTAPLPTGAPCGIRLGLGTMTVGGASMSQLASTLSRLLTRTVVDRTGLTGTFDATLSWTPDQATPGLAQKAGFVPQLVDQNGPSIFTAVQEQLGLKLESGKGPVNVLAIVGAQRPTGNEERRR